MSEHSSASKETQSPQSAHIPEVEAPAQGMASLNALGGQALSFTNPDPDNVLQLQRTLGNQVTMQLMGQSTKKINRIMNLRMASAVQRVDDVPKRPDSPDNNGVERGWAYQGDYGNGTDDDNNVTDPNASSEEDKTGIKTQLNELEEVGGAAFYAKYQSMLDVRIIALARENKLTDAQHEYYLILIRYGNAPVLPYLAGAVEAEKQAIAEKDKAQVKRNFEKLRKMLEYKDPRDFMKTLVKYPKLPDDADDEARKKHEQKVRAQDKVAAKSLIPEVSNLRKFYYGEIVVPENLHGEFEEVKTNVEANWSWAVAGKGSDRATVQRIVQLRITDLNKQDQGATRGEQALSGTAATLDVAGMGFTIADGVETINRLQEGAKGGDILSDALQGAVLWVIGKAFAGVVLGMDLINLFNKHLRRMTGYKATMDKLGVDTDGNIQDDSVKQDTDKNRLANIAFYAWQKTRRAVANSAMKIALKIIKWISYAITLVSGGTTAFVTATIAIAADATRLFTGLYSKIKGLIKKVGGKRGKARQSNASDLLGLAIGGDKDALQTIIDVNPFDEANIVTKAAWNATFGKKDNWDVMKLPKPKDTKQLKDWLAKGPYSNPEAQAALAKALTNTMASQ